MKDTDVKIIKQDIAEIKADLRDHMSRTLLNEKRIELMEDFATKALDNQQSNFKDMLKSNKENQTALNRQLKISLGVFAALAVLIGAMVPIISAINN
jgi:hypothetical protein